MQIIINNILLVNKEIKLPLEEKKIVFNWFFGVMQGTHEFGSLLFFGAISEEQAHIKDQDENIVGLDLQHSLN
ncbi:MAG: hypothetical protein ACJA1A_002865 [Saprospiraceae bacterium]